MTRKESKKKWMIGVLVIGATILGLSFLTLSVNTVYFYTPAEAKEQSRDLYTKTVQVGGMVQAGSVDWSPKELMLKFMLTDYQGNDIRIAYNGTAPDMFKEGQGVIVEGRLDESGASMTGQRLFVKHSEEYQAPDEMHSMDKELLKKSIFKDQ